MPPPPPPGGSELWSGTTLTDLDGDIVEDGEWGNQDIRDALNYGIPLPGGWVGYHGVMAGI